MASGTADRPIVFPSSAAVPQAGDWRGLWYGGIPRAANRVEHVRIEYAGGDCGCVLGSCSALTSSDVAGCPSTLPQMPTCPSRAPP